MRELSPCTACRRHILRSEVSCPFCTARVPLALALAIGLAGCGSDSAPPSGDRGPGASDSAPLSGDRGPRATASAGVDDLERTREREEQIREQLRLRLEVAVYGPPPRPRISASQSSQKPGPACTCMQTDPLCDCH